VVKEQFITFIQTLDTTGENIATLKQQLSEVGLDALLW